MRVISTRGIALWLDVPEPRAPNRTGVALQRWPRLDFDGDVEADVLVQLREFDPAHGEQRLCLAWLQVDRDGFLEEVFRLPVEWGAYPCVLEIAASGQKMVLEVSCLLYTSPSPRDS